MSIAPRNRKLQFTAGVSALSILALAACYNGARTAESVPTPAACEGTEIAVVRNETGAPVDVFVFSGRAEVPIGTAREGTNMLTLPPETSTPRAFNVRTLDGTAIRLSRPSQSPASRVSIAVECRS